MVAHPVGAAGQRNTDEPCVRLAEFPRAGHELARQRGRQWRATSAPKGPSSPSLQAGLTDARSKSTGLGCAAESHLRPAAAAVAASQGLPHTPPL